MQHDKIKIKQLATYKIQNRTAMSLQKIISFFDKN